MIADCFVASANIRRHLFRPQFLLSIGACLTRLTSDIYKYYVAYKMVLEQSDLHEKEMHVNQATL